MEALSDRPTSEVEARGAGSGKYREKKRFKIKPLL
jgi:hypothetical protein